jgi:predicted transglutaminase-like cysteine proteinase
MNAMRIEPIGELPYAIYVPDVKPRPKQLAVVDIAPLLPQSEKPATIWDGVSPAASPFEDLFKLLDNIAETKLVMIQYNNIVSLDADSGANYERYLQFPDSRIQAHVHGIVNPMDTNDQKLYKIEQWVIDNIEYVSDLEQYSENELWALPSMTLDSRQGDCEDGAFLIHSLALHAGVPSERLRTYGGIVTTNYGLGVGGHAWTAYQREIDDEWIIADWCYWATDTPLSERNPMSSNLKYLDDFFFVQATKTVETPYTNRVRFAASPPPLFINTVA